MTQVNTRVGVVLSSDNDKIEFFGYGVYEGEFALGDEAIGLLAQLLRECDICNPRIRLDSGVKIYGCECWWGAEDKIKKMLEASKNVGKQIIIVDINVYRKKWKKEVVSDNGK